MSGRLRTAAWLLALSALSALCGLFAGAVQAQPQTLPQAFSVKSIELRGKTAQGQEIAKGALAMPFVAAVAGGPGEGAAARINDFLFITMVGRLAPRQAVASLTVQGGDELAGTADQRFTVTRNDGRILTLAFDIEGCGAYCESYQQAWSFEAQSGRTLAAQNLFTPAGLRALAMRMGAERAGAYRQQLRTLAADLKKLKAKKGGASKEDMDDTEDRIALNEGCLKELRPQPGDFAYYRFEVTKAAVAFTAGRCSNHASRALDDVGDVTLKLPFAELSPHLTAYGKALLLDDAAGAVPVPAEPFLGQVLHGTLNADGKPLPVTMLVSASTGQRPEEGVSGRYFYDRIGKPIDLAGKAVGNTLELDERTTPDSSEPSAQIRLTRSAQGLAGQWMSKAKRFEMRLAP